MKILLVIIAGTAILVFLKTSKWLLNKISLKYPFWKNLPKSYRLIEIVIWTVFIFTVTDFLFKGRVFYSFLSVGMVLIIIVLITWYFLRDVFAGAVFKMQKELHKGDFIKIGDISGQIKSVHLTYLEILSESGKIINIPNTRLTQDLIFETSARSGIEELSIRLIFDKSLTKSEIEEKIRKEINSSPWCNYKNPPFINLFSEDEHTITYDVMVHALNNKHLRIVEKILKNKFKYKNL